MKGIKIFLKKKKEKKLQYNPKKYENLPGYQEERDGVQKKIWNF